MKLLPLFNSSPVEIPVLAEKFIDQLMNQLKNHDLGTYEHCGRVSAMCLDLAKNLQLSLLEQAQCAYAGLLHDVGKIKVPVNVINKPSKLTSEEFEIMKNHTTYGMEMIAPLTENLFFKKVSDAILYHHERVDGKGYHGISSDQIPYFSKIILVADTVDAMGQDRAYRKGLPMNVIIDELIRCSGTQFDAHIVNVFLESTSQKQKAA